MGASLPAAVLWDMDGTLVDTEPYWIDAERELVHAWGGTWGDDLAHACVGNPLLVSAELIRAGSPVDLPPEEIVDRLLGRVVARMREHVPWRPGARELLLACVAEGIPNALVTMSYLDLAQVLLDALPPGTFTAVVTGDRVGRGKPHPEPYLTAAARLGADPARCVAVEDSPPGVASAVAAGVPTVAVPHVVPVPEQAGAVHRRDLTGLTPAGLAGLADAARTGRRPVRAGDVRPA